MVDEGLAGADDRAVLLASQSEGRVLVTLDRNFADPSVLLPNDAGVVVVRPATQSLHQVRDLFRSALTQIDPAYVRGTIVVVEPGRIRRATR